MNFPNIASPSFPLTEISTDHTLYMQVDNDPILPRPRFTKMPRSFKLTWDSLPSADYNKLRTFYRDSTKGGAISFNWTYPITDPDNALAGKVFEVRFNDTSLEFQLKQFGYWTGSVTLQVV